jgi:hypothetical protein
VNIQASAIEMILKFLLKLLGIFFMQENKEPRPITHTGIDGNENVNVYLIKANMNY